MIAQALLKLPDFALFFSVSLALVGVYLLVYTVATSHNEFGLIRQNNIAARALSLGLSLTGFALPLSSAVVHSTTIADFWSGAWSRSSCSSSSMCWCGSSCRTSRPGSRRANSPPRCSSAPPRWRPASSTPPQ